MPSALEQWRKQQNAGRCHRLIMPYEAREELKCLGWHEYHHRTLPFERAKGLWCVMEAHYWTAREALEHDSYHRRNMRKLLKGQHDYYPDVQLEIDWYTEHWLAANAHDFEDHVVCPSTILYHARATPHLPKGHSIYLFNGVDLRGTEPGSSCWCHQCGSNKKRRKEIKREQDSLINLMDVC